MEEICPFKTDKVFWKKEGGAVISADIHTHQVYVRGGEWKLTLFNSSKHDASIDMYLAFCYEGAEYQSLEGDVNECWHPNLAGQRFHDAMRLSKWSKSYVLKTQATRKFTFKIGNFNVKVSEWLSKKQGWPFVYLITSGCNPKADISMTLTMSKMITFTEGEDSRYALSREEINKFQKSIDMLKEQLGIHIAGPADTTMDTSANPTN